MIDDLPRNRANFVPMTPVSFLERAALVYPHKVAVRHGRLAYTYREFEARARRLAAALAAREDLPAADFYYAGMLNWLAENLDAAAESFQKFFAAANPAAEKLQTARSIVIVAAARRKNFDEAEKLLADYLKTEPTKLTERARMETELANG